MKNNSSTTVLGLNRFSLKMNPSWQKGCAHSTIVLCRSLLFRQGRRAQGWTPNLIWNQILSPRSLDLGQSWLYLMMEHGQRQLFSTMYEHRISDKSFCREWGDKTQEAKGSKPVDLEGHLAWSFQFQAWPWGRKSPRDAFSFYFWFWRTSHSRKLSFYIYKLESVLLFCSI